MNGTIIVGVQTIFKKNIMNLETYAKKISPVFWQDLLQDAYASPETDKLKVMRSAIWNYKTCNGIDYTKFEGTEIVCKKCNELKPVAFFRTQEYNGNRWTCKTCKTCIAKQKKERYNSDEKYRESIKRNMQKYRSKSGVRERELLAQRERYYNRDKEKEKQRQAVYREKNRERIREYDRKWRQNKKLSKV